MNTTYSPQKHAAALADWTALLLNQSQAIAALRGDVARLVHALAAPTDQAQDAAFDPLVQAAFNAMGTRVWIAVELLGYRLGQSVEALDLTRAIEATGKTTPRSLGKYLAANIPRPAYLTSTGLEIRRCGNDGNSLAWTIARV